MEKVVFPQFVVWSMYLLWLAKRSQRKIQKNHFQDSNPENSQNQRRKSLELFRKFSVRSFCRD